MSLGFCIHRDAQPTIVIQHENGQADSSIGTWRVEWLNLLLLVSSATCTPVVANLCPEYSASYKIREHSLRHLTVDVSAMKALQCEHHTEASATMSVLAVWPLLRIPHLKAQAGCHTHGNIFMGVDDIVREPT